MLNAVRLNGEERARVSRQRWRIEDAFNVVKRLPGLAYFIGSSANAVATQVWASWILYSVLVDLAGAIAQELHRPFAEISIVREYRGLYHYTQAHKWDENDDVVGYLTRQTNLGIVKRVKSLQNHLINA